MPDDTKTVCCVCGRDYIILELALVQGVCRRRVDIKEHDIFITDDATFPMEKLTYKETVLPFRQDMGNFFLENKMYYLLRYARIDKSSLIKKRQAKKNTISCLSKGRHFRHDLINCSNNHIVI
jgi:hypothetical protein